MYKFVALGFVAALVAIAVANQAGAEETPAFPQPEKEHAWLGQLVGEWEADVQMFPPGQSPIKSKGTETVRAIGGFWIQAENKGEFAGQPFTGLLTLGYGPQQKQYVGTWVDSMGSYLWTYEGSVDKSGKVLTLETSGPCPTAPGQTSQFKEVIELKSKDHKTFTSSMQNEDGKWTTMMKIDYHRKK